MESVHLIVTLICIISTVLLLEELVTFFTKLLQADFLCFTHFPIYIIFGIGWWF